MIGPVSSWMIWPKHGVLLRRPADDGERPDRPLAVIDALDVQHREIVGEAVIAEVVAERPFRQLPRRIDGADDAEIGLGRHRQEWIRLPTRRAGGRTSRTRRPPSAPAKVSSGIPSGSGITAASVRAGGPPTKMLTRNGTPRRRAVGVMDADAAMDLVVQTDLPVRLVLVAGQLHAIHAEVGVPPAGPVRVLGVDLRQRDEGAAVARPALQLRQLAHRRLVGEDRPAAHELRQGVPAGRRGTSR